MSEQLPVKRVGTNNNEEIGEIPKKTLKNDDHRELRYVPMSRPSIYGPAFHYGPNRKVFKQKPYLVADYSDNSDVEASSETLSDDGSDDEEDEEDNNDSETQTDDDEVGTNWELDVEEKLEDGSMKLESVEQEKKE